jgi:tetratricopeptide (TPR) repeat protein
VTRTLGAALLLATAGLGVARTQPRLASTVHAAKERADLYVLPPPAELHAITLGCDAAVVDLLWAKLLVEYGTHWSEKREFRDTPRYVDAILELEPTYAPVYKLVAVLLAYRPLQGTEDDVRKAREYLERGTRERPQDSALWMDYGMFVAFMAPSFLYDDAEREAWRKDGATAIGHAVEIGADADRALAAANVLTRAGATEAAIRFLERAYAITEKPSMADVHDAIGRALEGLQATARRDTADAEWRAVNARWTAELPYLTRDQYLLMGPKVDVARCSGLAAAGEPECARDWTADLISGPSRGSSASSP